MKKEEFEKGEGTEEEERNGGGLSIWEARKQSRDCEE